MQQLIEVAQQEIPFLMQTLLWPWKVSGTSCPAQYADVFPKPKWGIEFISSHSGTGNVMGSNG